VKDNIDHMARKIHGISTGKGFTPPSLDNLPEKLMLAVSELAESLEEHRAGRPLVWFKHEFGCKLGEGIQTVRRNPACTCEAKPEGVLVEIGDAVIRCLHMMHSLLEETGEIGLLDAEVSDVLNLKINYNAGRPAMHGKAY
jgi:hypothetical protein